MATWARRGREPTRHEEMSAMYDDGREPGGDQ
jgi:hypothetical protein